MYYRFDSRVVIQTITNHLHYCKVVSASTDVSYPFSIPAASIEIIANSGNMRKADYISNIHFDDIVRLQVTVRYSPTEKAVWYDLFEGRIMSIQANYGTTTTATLLCVGHANEAGYTLLDEAKTYATATDIKDILTYYSTVYMVRNQIKVYNDVSTGLTCQYNTKKGQKYMKDLLCDCEELSGFDWYFEQETNYNTSGTLASVQMRFRPFETTATRLYKAIQGTPRFISGNFELDGSEVYTKVIEYGDTPSGGTQVVGSDYSATNIPKYGVRVKVNTDTGLTSTALCDSFAHSVLPKVKDPRTSGSIVLMGTPKAKIGQLVYCKSSQIDINGEPLDGTYSVMKVHHEMGSDAFTTTIDVGKAQSDIEDYIAEFARRNRLNMQNFIS